MSRLVTFLRFSTAALFSLTFAAGAAPAASAQPAESAEPAFREITSSAGIVFTHANGAQGEKQYWESMGSGVCVFDADGDDALDLYFVDAMGPNRLWRGDGKGRFHDVTDTAGVGDPSYGMGAIAGDVDNDGDSDLYVTNFGPNRLYRNRGDGTFELGPRAAADSAWGCGAVFFDADRDGWLDLYVVNYVQVARPDTNVCFYKNRQFRLICNPLDYPPAADVFYRNRGDGTFEEATERFGFSGIAGRGLGAVTLDYDRDGWIDLYVANDLDPNYFIANRGDGTFEERGLFTGTSHSESGREESGMGVAAGDYDEDGWTDLFVTNFVGQTNTLYHNEGAAGLFLDESTNSRLGPVSLPYVGWGTQFFDWDLDGWLDVFVVNGHVEPDADRAYASTYPQANLLFRNRGDGTFDEVAAGVAPDFAAPQVGRGAAVLDFDDDGDPDLAVSNQNGPGQLFENVAPRANHWIGFELTGTRSNRDAIGAQVEIHAGGVVRRRERTSGSSFLSHSDARILVGLGPAASVDSVVVHWPSGGRDVLRAPEIDRYLAITESR